MSEKITDHPFKPSKHYPAGEGCSHIIGGFGNTIYDPDCCRKSESEHEKSERQ